MISLLLHQKNCHQNLNNHKYNRLINKIVHKRLHNLSIKINQIKINNLCLVIKSQVVELHQGEDKDDLIDYIQSLRVCEKIDYIVE